MEITISLISSFHLVFLKAFGNTSMKNSTEQDIFIELRDLPQWGHLENEWLELENRSDPSFFTSWAWIGCWLSCLPAKIQPRLLRATVGEKTIGMGLLVTQKNLRHHLMPVKCMNLHATGNPYFDVIFIEYNGFLADREMQSMVVPCMIKYLDSQGGDWEELHLDGFTNPPVFKLPEMRDMRVRRQLQIHHYVDLDELRSASGGYLSFLGQNTRHNIRRSIKEFSIHGQISLTSAENTDEALVFLSGLKQFHQTYWQSRGMPGAFANSFFESFHESLIRTRFDYGEIQLIRLSAGDRPFGYLYNIIHRGIVHNYQSGFDFTITDKHSRPGLVSHCLAIDFNVTQRHRVYDFMAGDSQYKQALGTHCGEMYWIVLQRDLLKFRIENGLRSTKRWLICVLNNTSRINRATTIPQERV
jgi:hypothetical protein